MLIKDKKIAIVGGGPGGLTLARLLQLKGANVQVFERDADKYARQQGATLDLHDESGLKAVERAELIEQFKQNYRPGAETLRVVNEEGALFLDEHAQPKDIGFGNEYFRPEIDRGPLRDIFIDSLQPGTILWDHQFISMESKNGGWLLTFKNEKSVYADIVIAADGANSKIRPYISNSRPVYSGIMMVEGNIYHAEKNAPALHALVKGGKVFALGKDKSIILSAKGDGCLSFCTGCWEQEGWINECGIDFNNRASVFVWFKQRFADWSMLWHELFATDEIYFVPRPMYHYPPGQHWEALSNVTMLGDAAHRMPPYAGEGVNMAMLDALELSECFTNGKYPDLKTAIANFEKQMCQRAGEITTITLNQMQALHSPGAIKHLLNIFQGM
ncbi:2-polyprenyl-6-methoxyphenol hydroxylase [Niastella vici]|uniref:Flavin-dependent monooxygenase n=1 Tax=Niastella vici TaxID=1703345 RepID=A0A1V9FYN6_9BACT|nr:NAD(P)/FAD-dependent oxidoreductase [Niastella vici]OQP63481.1 2-polyprenyl-6-methoxyphenol hydroxylase [Niastella vici]